MISISHKAIFIHIPKCAGQSVEETFLKDISEDLAFERHRHLLGCFQRPRSWAAKFPERLAHLTAHEYTALSFVSPSLWNDCFKFAIVRSPVDRCVSMWRYLGELEMDFDRFVHEHLPAMIADRHYFYKSQSEYLVEPGTRKILVDQVVAFHALNDEWAEIQRRTGLSTALLKRNTSTKRQKPEVSRSAAQAIESMYKDDYDLLAQWIESPGGGR